LRRRIAHSGAQGLANGCKETDLAHSRAIVPSQSATRDGAWLRVRVERGAPVSCADGLEEVGGYRISVLAVGDAAAYHEFERSKMSIRGRAEADLRLVADYGCHREQLKEVGVKGMSLCLELAPHVEKFRVGGGEARGPRSPRPSLLATEVAVARACVRVARGVLRLRAPLLAR